MRRLLPILGTLILSLALRAGLRGFGDDVVAWIAFVLESIAVFRFAQEFSGSEAFAAAAVLCFNLVKSPVAWLGRGAPWWTVGLAGLLLLFGLLRQGPSAARFAPILFVAWWIGFYPSLNGDPQLAGSPSLTDATLFLGLAVFARFLTLDSPGLAPKLSATDIPATRMSVQPPPPPSPWSPAYFGFASLILVATLFSPGEGFRLTFLAPIVLTAAIARRGRRPRWPWAIGLSAAMLCINLAVSALTRTAPNLSWLAPFEPGPARDWTPSPLGIALCLIAWGYAATRQPNARFLAILAIVGSISLEGREVFRSLLWVSLVGVAAADASALLAPSEVRSPGRERPAPGALAPDRA